MRVLVAAGTRPEVIKLAPVVQELRRAEKPSEVLFCATGQHREMLDQAMQLFGLKADVNLELMTPNQSLDKLTATLLERVTVVLEEFRPDWVIVQGDTTTTMATALAAFYLKQRVAHIEAGLRTGDRFHPFPEEVNRRITDLVADVMFAPTPRAAANLSAEGYRDDRIIVTGNTGIDALLQFADRPASAYVQSLFDAGAHHGRHILVTVHRRESFGEPLTAICSALLRLADRFDDVRFLLPVHPNPNVRTIVTAALGSHPSFVLTEPLGYADFIAVMKRSYVILSDSGGVQEEAPSLNTPVLVMRDVTERPEAIEAGTARLIGTATDRIVDETSALLLDETRRQAMTQIGNPFGDGHASRRIVAALHERLQAR